jgi:hypothetical protein
VDLSVALAKVVFPVLLSPGSRQRFSRADDDTNDPGHNPHRSCISEFPFGSGHRPIVFTLVKRIGQTFSSNRGRNPPWNRQHSFRSRTCALTNSQALILSTFEGRTMGLATLSSSITSEAKINSAHQLAEPRLVQSIPRWISRDLVESFTARTHRRTTRIDSLNLRTDS